MNKKKRKIHFSGLLYLLLIIICILLAIVIFYLNIIPFGYYVLLLIIILGGIILLLYMLSSRFKVIKIMGIIIMLTFLLVVSLGLFFSIEFLKLMDRISFLDKESVNYCIYSYEGSDDGVVYYLEDNEASVLS